MGLSGGSDVGLSADGTNGASSSLPDDDGLYACLESRGTGGEEFGRSGRGANRGAWRFATELIARSGPTNAAADLDVTGFENDSGG
jgi:hypothetical protein